MDHNIKVAWVATLVQEKSKGNKEGEIRGHAIFRELREYQRAWFLTLIRSCTIFPRHSPQPHIPFFFFFLAKRVRVSFFSLQPKVPWLRCLGVKCVPSTVLITEKEAEGCHTQSLPHESLPSRKHPGPPIWSVNCNYGIQSQVGLMPVQESFLSPSHSFVLSHRTLFHYFQTWKTGENLFNFQSYNLICSTPFHLSPFFCYNRRAILLLFCKETHLEFIVLLLPVSFEKSSSLSHILQQQLPDSTHRCSYCCLSCFNFSKNCLYSLPHLILSLVLQLASAPIIP